MKILNQIAVFTRTADLLAEELAWSHSVLPSRLELQQLSRASDLVVLVGGT